MLPERPHIEQPEDGWQQWETDMGNTQGRSRSPIPAAVQHLGLPSVAQENGKFAQLEPSEAFWSAAISV